MDYLTPHLSPPTLISLLSCLILSILLTYRYLWPRVLEIADGKGEIRITRLYVHPIKSTKGISVQETAYDINGLEYDRRWAIINPLTGVVATARECPSLVMVESIIDRQNNLLRVSFPASSKLPGFAVPLDPTADQKSSYKSVSNTIMHDIPLFPVLIPLPLPTSSTPITPSPSEQFTTYLATGVEYEFVIQGKEKRELKFPRPGEGELEYPGGGETGFADGYPMLLASEESYLNVQSSITTLLLSPSLPPSIQKSAPLWPLQGASLEMERFRPNVVVSGKGVRAFDEEKWGRIEIAAEGREGEERGGMVIVSRCGRCQLPNVSPSTGLPDPSLPFKAISKYRRVDPVIRHTPCFGVNTVPVRSAGVYRVGDVVRVVGMNDWVVLDGKGGDVK